jgi:hypothetical protein
VAVPANVTACPGAMVMLPAGLVIVATGGWFVGVGDS